MNRWEIMFAALFTALAYFLFDRNPGLSKRVIGFFRADGRVTLYIAAAMLGPLALRLMLLPWIPVPQPKIHDEFGHLLVADTLMAGRLANPQHPLWRHLETIYVLQRPTYASIYPIGQGMVLAAGKRITGSPWAGVLIATALMCGATSWMLFGCLPPGWAATGGLLAAFALAARWEDSYWGGAFCAFGGALLFGALCRLRERPAKLMGLVAGAGWTIVWLTRPFESLLLMGFMWGWIAVLAVGSSGRRRAWLGTAAMALCVQGAAGLVTARHNRAVTGSYTTTPYQLSQATYGVPQGLKWQPTIREPVLAYRELRDMYWWQRDAKEAAAGQMAHHLGSILRKAWSFFVTPWFTLPLMMLAAPKNRDVWVWGGMTAMALGAGVLYPFFFAHYIAAYACVIFFLIMRGMMTLYDWRFCGRAVGRPVAVFLMAGGLAMGMRIAPMGADWHGGKAHAGATRERVAERLMTLGNRHVVFVRYEPGHDFHDEWIYNGADIDGSGIVWCRTAGRVDDEVVRYFRDRQAWVVDVDEEGGRISLYRPDSGGY